MGKAFNKKYYKRKRRPQCWKRGNIPWNNKKSIQDDANEEVNLRLNEEASPDEPTYREIVKQCITPGTQERILTTISHEVSQQSGLKKVIISMGCANSSKKDQESSKNNEQNGDTCAQLHEDSTGESTQSEFSCGQQDTEDQPFNAIKRPLFTETLAPSSFGDELLKPFKLRPTKIDSTCFTEHPSVHENVIVNLHSLNNLVALFIDHANTRCEYPTPQVVVTQRRGLCIQCKTVCRNCSYDPGESVKLYTECRVGTRGQMSGTINESLMLSTMKTKVGPSDLNFILSALNIKPPAYSLMYKKLNRLSDTMVKLNEKSMIRDLKQSLGQSPMISVETDTSYNNRMQAGYEASTTSFTPMIEQETGYSLPLSAVIYNKVCSSQTCSHENSDKCHRNYTEDESMSSTESKAAAENIKRIDNENIVRVKSVTTDASAQVQNAIKNHATQTGRPISHELCFIHRMRTVQKNIKKLQLPSIPLPKKQHSIYMQRLSTCVRHRVRRELVSAHRLYGPSKFADKAWPAVSSIVRCFSGDHSCCKRVSLVCKAHLLQSYNSKFLPFGQHLKLNRDDLHIIQSTINNVLNKTVLEKLRNLSNTNKSETMHHRIFTYAPKSNSWQRNFRGMCASGLHSSKHGTGLSTIILSETINVKSEYSDPFHVQMIERDRKTNLHRERKRRDLYKIKRYNTRKQKCNRNIRCNSLYNLNDMSIRHEHGYGLDMH
ncbi:hypothetical protein FSP39_010477 [Pinctada imbricata]|uniref:Mutator-like transposase domain-containing protein n=1 Tax=Pinctada imbricata TaxID=66713 RepID=A0AA88YKV4_PINIB|nr:hypothetical protein FSP39_010477 [Pinctada imbricata]